MSGYPNQILDVERLRRQTPGTVHCCHLNNAGAALMPAVVVDTMTQYLGLEAARGGYEAAESEAERIEAVYASIAELIAAEPKEIAITENSTVAWDMVFYSLEFEAGDRILTSRSEYAANYVAFLQVARKTGAVIEVIPNDASGATDPIALEAMLDERVKLVAINYVPTNGGLVNPAEAIGRVTSKHGVFYLLDACQAIGQMPVDVGVLRCDALTATGRKFLRGPRGTGFLFIRKARLDGLEPPMLDHFAAVWTGSDCYELRSDARRFETWENNYASRLGLGAAIDYASKLGLGPIRDRVRLLAERMRSGLASIPGVTLYDLGSEQSGIVTFTLLMVGSVELKQALAKKKINISVSEGNAALLDATARKLPLLARASPHYYNTEQEIDRFLEAVDEMRVWK